MDNRTKAALERQREILDAAKQEERDLTDAEQREFDTLQTIIDSEEVPEKEERSAADETPETGAETPEERSGYSPEEASEISAMCRFYGADAGKFFERNLTAAQVREEIIKEQMRKESPIGAPKVTKDEKDKFRQAAADGLLMRGGISLDSPAEGAREFQGMTMRDIAIEAMERENSGGNYRHMDSDSLFSELQRAFYNPESAFPAIMDEVVQKSYVEGLNKANVTFDRWVKIGSLPNFKKSSNHEYLMSLAGNLEKVPENGELKAYVPTDVKLPERKLETYGRQFTMTRQAFIDDDIGLLTSMPYRFGIISKRTQNDLVYDLLLEKKKIYDGKPLFDESRKNALKTGTDITLEAVQKMIYMIGIQKDEAGNQLALYPDIFIVPFGLGVQVKQLLATPTFYSADGTITNPYYGSGLEVIEDVTINARLEDGKQYPWFMGVKGQIIEVDYLNGQQEATIRRSEKPGTLGFIWDVYQDFSASVIHPQAVCKNPGVEKTLGDAAK